MAPVLVFFGVAVLVGCVIRGVGELRLRAARKAEADEAQVCSLEKANRISSVTLAASAVGLGILVLAYVVA
jgi:hypothetical protein